MELHGAYCSHPTAACFCMTPSFKAPLIPWPQIAPALTAKRGYRSARVARRLCMCRFGIYGDLLGQSQPVPPGTNLTADFAIQLARTAIFHNLVAADACVTQHVMATDYVNGLQDTLSIIENQD